MSFIMSYELTGKLIAKYDTVQRSETFKTREFVVENGRHQWPYRSELCEVSMCTGPH